MTQETIEKLTNPELVRKIQDLDSQEKRERATAICMNDCSSDYEYVEDQKRNFAKADDTKKLLDRLIAEGQRRVKVKEAQSAYRAECARLGITPNASTDDDKFPRY